MSSIEEICRIWYDGKKYILGREKYGNKEDVSCQFAAGLMFVYYMIVFRNIIEFKNYVVNIYNVFRAYNLMALLRKREK